jgi:hypothetical protein
MNSAPTEPRRPRGQAKKATVRLGAAPLTRNMVIRCSDELYRIAIQQAKGQNASLSDYVRRLILEDLQENPGKE